MHVAIRDAAAKILAEGLPVGPRYEPCCCGAPRHVHSGPQRRGGYQPTDCHRYRMDTAYRLAYRALEAQARSVMADAAEVDRRDRKRRRARNPKPAGHWSVGPSDAGRCRRQIGYRELPPDGFVPDKTNQRPALLGGLIHDALTRRLRRLYPWREFDQPLSIAGLDRDTYRPDEYDPITGTVTDYKTAGDWAWESLRDDGPDDGPWEQVMMYGLGLRELGRPVIGLRLVYVQRKDGRDEVFTRPFVVAEAQAALDKLLGIVTTLDIARDSGQDGRILPRDRLGPDHDGICRNCFARTHCWNLDRAAETGLSPARVTILGDEPDLPEIVWAAEQVVTHREAETEHKKAKEFHADVLDGIDTGTYGDYEAVPGRAPGTDWKAYAQALAAYYNEPEDQRPPLDSIVPPRHAPTGRLSWRRIRKAKRDQTRR